MKLNVSFAVCLLVLAFAQCLSYKIMVAFPVFDTYTENVMKSLSNALAAGKHELILMPARELSGNIGKWLQTVPVDSGVGEVPNVFKMSSVQLDFWMTSEIANAKENVKIFKENLLDKEYTRVDAIIVPLDQQDALSPFIYENPPKIVITVDIDGLADKKLSAFSIFVKDFMNELSYLSTWIGYPSAKHLKSSALTLINSHHIVVGTRDLLHSEVEVPGMDIERSHLTPKLKEFMDVSDLAYFDLGEFVNSTHMPVSLMETFLSVLKALPGRAVFRYEGSDHLGDHIMQVTNASLRSPILEHNNTKVYITTCDMESVHYGTRYGVPMLCMPVTTLQMLTADLLEKTGMARIIDWESAEKKTVMMSLRLLMEERYLKRAAMISAALNASCTDPLGVSVKRIERALQHKDEFLRMKIDPVNCRYTTFIALTFLGMLLPVAWKLLKQININILLMAWFANLFLHTLTNEKWLTLYLNVIGGTIIAICAQGLLSFIEFVRAAWTHA